MCVIYCLVHTEGIVDALGRERRLQLVKMFNLEIKSKKYEPRVLVSLTCIMYSIV